MHREQHPHLKIDQIVWPVVSCEDLEHQEQCREDVVIVQNLAGDTFAAGSEAGVTAAAMNTRPVAMAPLLAKHHNNVQQGEV